MVVDESADGQSLTLAVGESLMVELAENPTTGFRWTLTSDGAPACAASGESYEADQSTGLGRGGRHRWQFQAAQPGRGTIALSHSRPWEPGAPGRTFSLSVTVQ